MFWYLKLSGRKTFDKKHISILLTLPHLESLDVETVSSFPSVELPELKNLSRLKVTYDLQNCIVASFCDALKKMPKLKDLEMTITEARYIKSGSQSSKSAVLELVCKVAIEAASQNKEIVVWENKSYDVVCKKWIIAKQNAATSDMESQTLNLTIRFTFYEGFLENLRTFVLNNLEGYHVVVM